MLVETVADALRLRDELGHPLRSASPSTWVTASQSNPTVSSARCAAAGDLLVNVQVDDMLPGVHEHLELGRGGSTSTAALTTLQRDRIPRRGGGRTAPPLARRAGSRRTQHACTALGLGGTMTHHWTVERRGRHRRGTAAHHRAVPRGRACGRTRSGRTGDRPARAAVRHHRRPTRAKHWSARCSPYCPPTPRRQRSADLYRYGDDAERRGVLRGLNTCTRADRRRRSSTSASNSSPTRCARTTRGLSPPRSGTSPVLSSTSTPGGTAC